MDGQELADEYSSSQEHASASQLHEGDADERDTFSIMVATDNHLGYLERDPVRGNDSFAAFEEILALAAESEVDMILLGGDLFHENKPSRKTMHVTSKLLRKYCMGDKPVSIEFLSEPSDNFPDGVETVNYMDPNLNVSLPVFSIHGNHDDPSGDGNLCALDLLAMNGLVNYFGRSQEIDNVVVKPILLQKGESRLALFGIGNIRDERLHQTFLRRNVKMMRPFDEDDENPWFNLLVLHQNRVMHGPKSYIPEAFLDDFIQLVIWGHEHECLIDPMFNPQQNFHVTQPGSSVATSLSEGESKDKHVAILKISGNKFSVKKIRLTTVRPFIMDDLILSDHGLDPNNQQKVNTFISRKVKELIEKAKNDWISKNGQTSRKRRMYSDNDSDQEEAAETNSQQNQEVPKPLVRLRVEYSGGFEIFNPQRFGVKAAPEIDKVELTEKLDTMRVENLVQKYLSAQNLSILPEIQLADAVRVYVEKDEKDAVKDFVSTSLARMRTVIESKQNIEVEEALLKEINKEKDSQAAKYAREHSNGALLDHKRTQARENSMDVDDDRATNDHSESEDEQAAESRSKSKKVTSRGASRAVTPAVVSSSSGSRSRAKASSPAKAAPSPSASRARATKTRVLAADSQDDDDDEDEDKNDEEEEDLPEIEETLERSAKGKGRAPARATRGRESATVILDTDEEGDQDHSEALATEEVSDDEFVAPSRVASAAAKGKGRAKSPTKAKPTPKVAAAPKRAAKKTDVGTSAAGASTTRAATPAKASQGAASQPSQGPSRLVSAIGSRKKKLF
ncbi:Double-strand break repair protein mre11a [Gryganskiella cystojenkinii]|nr:Double-strand break repair protein mre11a [Gryganskiella cystojenkinii]